MNMSKYKMMDMLNRSYNTLFVIADDLYFAEHKLIDLTMDFYQRSGKKLSLDLEFFFCLYINVQC